MTTLQAALKTSILALRKIATERTDPALKKLLCSIPGIGIILSDAFIAEIGDVKRLPNDAALVAFAGLDPKVKQSGTMTAKHLRLTKRGSPALRTSAFLAASIAQRHDPDLKAYYLKKRKEGRQYREATVANARHILSRVYAVWKRGTPYVPRALKSGLLDS